MTSGPRGMGLSRVCGETACQGEIVAYAEGLSPRVRGNHDPQCVAWLRERSIPACAGKPATTSTKRTSGQVYPRVCGETSLAGAVPMSIIGLSPRVRGNPNDRTSAPSQHGSIPACAGKPHILDTPSTPLAVYPRVCGETSFAC